MSTQRNFWKVRDRASLMGNLESTTMVYWPAWAPKP
jgi:hypothetical protein